MWFEYWWVFPLGMLVLCLFMCFFMMRGGRGSMGSMMCGWGSRRDDARFTESAESAMDILDKRYARGEIDQREYEETKAKLTRHQGDARRSMPHGG